MVTIYKITNTLNNKPYVGQTRQPLEKRFLQHAKAHTPLGDAMRTCGLENFILEVIERCETLEQAKRQERFWIRVLNCRVPHGYNQSDGGEGGLHKPKSASAKEVSRMFTSSLKKLRNSVQISQKDFAQALNVSQQTVASWESGRTEPSNNALAEIADYFNVSTDYLLGRDAPALSDEQATLIKGFDMLNAAGRNLLVAVLDSLRVSHAAKMSNRRVAAV